MRSMSYIIEAETGTYTGTRHPHNGYYAGDFSSSPMATRQQLDMITRMRPPTPSGPSS
jgi:hypothetical protein